MKIKATIEIDFEPDCSECKHLYTETHTVDVGFGDNYQVAKTSECNISDINNCPQAKLIVEDIADWIDEDTVKNYEVKDD